MNAQAERFEESLQSFDSLLSIRDGIYGSNYIVERRAYIPQTEIWFLKRRTDRLYRFWQKESDPAKKEKLYFTFMEVAEELHSARSGKRVVVFTDNLDQRVYNSLAMSDIKRYGGYSRYADELDRRDKEREMEAEREAKRIRDDLSEEAFDKLKFAFANKENKLEHYDGRQSLTEILR